MTLTLLEQVTCPVVIRVNVDEKNIQHVCELLDDLSSRGIPVSSSAPVYIDVAPVFTTGCSTQAPMSDSMLSGVLGVQKLAISLGFRIRNAFNLEPCFSSGVGSFEIDPHGDVYTCQMFADCRTMKVADVSKDDFEPAFYSLMSCQPYEESCLECSYFPICAGGCRVSAFLDRKDPLARVCSREWLDKSVRPRLALYFSQPWIE